MGFFGPGLGFVHLFPLSRFSLCKFWKLTTLIARLSVLTP
jgi:hypothetical protein